LAKKLSSLEWCFPFCTADIYDPGSIDREELIMAAGANRVAETFQKSEKELLASWMSELKGHGADLRICHEELNSQTREFL
jgi:hypothetical protein